MSARGGHDRGGLHPSRWRGARCVVVLAILAALGCAPEPAPEPVPGETAPWVEVVLENGTGQRVVEATLSPFDTLGFVQSALDQTLAPDDSVRIRVRAGTWSLRYVTERGQASTEPALDLTSPRTIRME